MRAVHEVRDPIHVFVRLSADERKVLDSIAIQRLRHIHQLALTYLVYPGATHRRFEHSIGVMELATRIFDTITDLTNLDATVTQELSEIRDQQFCQYWRSVLRVAALCHDIGHLPFSHVAEKDLLPAGWDHERLTRELICSGEMRSIWDSFEIPIRVEDIVKLAIGPKKAIDLQFSPWERLLSEVIIGDAFGADRMDYLLRDSYHTGVAYGRFDYHRVIDTIRILRVPAEEETGKETSAEKFFLGAEEGGLHAIESLLLARYAMYSQVYFHHVRRIYDLHLIDFLQSWLPNGMFPTEAIEHLRYTDNEVNSAIYEIARSERPATLSPANRIHSRNHFKLLYSRNPSDLDVNPNPGQAIFEALCTQFEPRHFKRDVYRQRNSPARFPVSMRDGRVVWSQGISEILNRIPLVAVDFVFADSRLMDKAKRWIKRNRLDILRKVRDDLNDE